MLILVSKAKWEFCCVFFRNEQLTTIENDDCIYTFPIKEGYKKVSLKRYKTFEQQPLIAFEDNGYIFNFSFITNDSKTPIQTEKLYFFSTVVSQKFQAIKNRPCI